MDKYRKNLRDARKKINKSSLNIATLLGMSKSAYEHRETGRTKITYDFACRMADITGEPISKFYKLKTPPADLAYREANAEIVNIPVYDLAASAGPGSFVDQHQNPSWIEPFSKKFLASLRAHSNELAILFAGGDSMEPTIKDGALLIVDMSANALNLRSDGIYVIWHDETLKVKRLQFATGYIKAKSDNPLYDDVTIKNDHHFAIQGRVIWYGQNS